MKIPNVIQKCISDDIEKISQVRTKVVIFLLTQSKNISDVVALDFTDIGR